MGNVLFLMKGLLNTVGYSLAALIIGIPLGFLIALIRTKRIPMLSRCLAMIVSFLRGVPLILLILMFYFGLSNFGLNIPAFMAGGIALTLNHAAFVSEIFRGAILNFPNDQVDAAVAYGMLPNQILRRVMLPQILRVSLPALTSEITLIIKTSPAIGIIGINDLTRSSSQLAASNFQPIIMISIAMVIYVAMLLALARVSHGIDIKVQRRYELV
ncbi:MAG: amino acid ABC transporter permease [Cyanobacteria bacterium P01_H01_bin.58]